MASAEMRQEIQQALLEWFRANARDLPWRRTRDPYRILVSEIMLQQTQVDRVIPYYERFLERFPTVESLANAATADVIRIWSGLGYNRRAINLQRAAKVVVDEFGGLFPHEPGQLRSLPGVGAYTAGAIAAFAFECDAVFLDTNMRRVISRIAFGSDAVTEARALNSAADMLPPGKGWEWNQALIEFGALQCTARLPACVVCPVQRSCLAFPTIQSSLAGKRASARRLASTPFTATSRYFRGRIVEVLRDLPVAEPQGIDLGQLGSLVRPGFSNEDMPWLRGLVEGLQNDGLAVIAEEAVPYDEASPVASRTERVRLP